ncbi:hypothetical protein LFL96_25985 [Paraburkholderia sp. D15]|uniref:hypothetical protein n=1 Tax=Paraburkholderia sp. D15 TaxID=2880218 RepID=UPI00247A4263|nr:hypothetical protein [Paraburkholderia sp. D15]WGS54467.1 hypothetical protein LFL96_25985 [Paraburkholderia sp. D15]
MNEQKIQKNVCLRMPESLKQHITDEARTLGITDKEFVIKAVIEKLGTTDSHYNLKYRRLRNGKQQQKN